MFSQLKKYKLRANREKCAFFRVSLKFLGHLITPEGIKANPSKLDGISKFSAPRNLRNLKTFLTNMVQKICTRFC